MIFLKQSARLRLDIAGQAYTFATPDDLEFALQGRTDVPSDRARRYLDIDSEALRHEALSMREVEKRFAQVLESSARGEADIGAFLGALDLSVVSKDHEWREIIQALNHAPDVGEAYQKVALVKYMQYLAARQEILRQVYADQHGEAAPDLMADSADRMGETSVFAPATEFRASLGTHRLHRLPKGETLELTLDPDERVELLLALAPCAIILRDTPIFVDPDGNEHRLRRGRSVVGRDAAAEVRISASLRDVSRKHLLIDSDGESTLHLLDISSHGTSIDDSYLDDTSI